MSASIPAVVAEGLWKRYGDTTALGGFDLTVPAGTVCGLLGPNGAGKTTAVRVLTTLLQPDKGNAEITGLNVQTQRAQVRSRIGLVGQHAAVDEVLSGEQNLTMFARLYHLDAKAAARRAAELLEQFGLTDASRKPVNQYSGGMRRRLDLAVGLIFSPSVLFLDEPTTGLDPRSRTEVWDAVRCLVSAGTTVLLTTQYLEEADQLADDVAVIDAGRVIAKGTPTTLKSLIGGDRLDIVLGSVADMDTAASLLEAVSGNETEVDVDRRRVSVPVSDRVGTLIEVARALHQRGLVTEDLELRRPTLDEVFLHLTGGADSRVSNVRKVIP